MAGEGDVVRTAGFPCRVLGCERAFQVLDQRSMDSLNAASAARSEHEVTDHDYHHVRLADAPPFKAFQRPTQKPASRT